MLTMIADDLTAERCRLIALRQDLLARKPGLALAAVRGDREARVELALLAVVLLDVERDLELLASVVAEGGGTADERSQAAGA